MSQPVLLKAYSTENGPPPVPENQSKKMKRRHDPTPHEVFCELQELGQSSYGGLEWKETARWIKYEEAVELRSNRWGKPHVSVINFNALFSLRKGLDKGAIVLDLEAKDMTTIAAKIAEYLVVSNQIPSSQKDNVYKLLLLNRRHIKEFVNPLRRASKFTSMSYDEESNYLDPGTSPTPAQKRRSRSSSIRKSLSTMLKQRGSFARGSFSSSVDSNYDDKADNKNSLAQLEVDAPLDDRDVPKRNLDLKRKLADDAEALACFIGALDFLLQPAIAFVRLAEGVVMDNVIEVPIPVRFFFVLLGPYGAGIDYKEIGRAFATLMSEKNFHEAVYEADSRGQILNAINDFLNTSIILPPTEWKNNDLIPLDEIRYRTRENTRKVEEAKAQKLKTDEKDGVAVKQIEAEDIPPPPEERDPLKRRGILFYGVAQDIKIRYSRYLSDIIDGFSPQVLSASIFIFFAALSPAITFGGLYGEKTNRLMGVGETLLLSSINGVFFSLLSAQPIIIVGATGPLMIFDMSLLSFCNNMDIDYLGIRVWIGIWILVIGLIVGAFELVAVVKKFTKFTEEIYATLVCIIFIYGAFESMVGIFKQHPLVPPICEENDTLFGNVTLDSFDSFDSNSSMLNETAPAEEEEKPPVNQPNTALLSMCLMLGTFILAIKLKNLRNKKYFGRQIRRALGDFGVPISIFLMVLISYFITGVYLDRLHMPKGIQPSNSKIRGWLISPFGAVGTVPVWAMFAAGPASLLLFILIFLEENICHLILMNPDRGLKKGTGFHLDIVLSCAMNTFSGFLGAPFMSPACVRTISHMSALTVFSDKVAPGEAPKIVGCIEQRISNLTVSLLIGLSVMLYFVLNLVPNAVLLGVFLYMGVSATAGIQFLDRTFLYFMPVKYHPNLPYAKDVPTLKMHLFTTIQIIMLVIAWIVKQSPASLAVPFILMCLIPIRMYILPRIFSVQELIALDGAKKVEHKTGEEPDFYEHVHDLPTQIEMDK